MGSCSIYKSEHRGFRQSDRSIFALDIGLLILQGDAILSTEVWPICLYHPELNASLRSELTVAGWGRTETERNPSELRFTKLTKVPASVCEREWSKELQKNPNPLLRSGMKILGSQFCAGDVNRLSDACLGASGGPIMVELNNRWYLVGVTSAGSPRCKSTPPGLYTRVSSFWPWLAENIFV